MKYVDGFVMVVPDENMPAYRKMAKMGEKLWKKYGALKYFECAGDDLTPDMPGITFPKMTKAGAGETVVFSFIARLMNDPKNKDMTMPFDMNRMAYGGFEVIVGG